MVKSPGLILLFYLFTRCICHFYIAVPLTILSYIITLILFSTGWSSQFHHVYGNRENKGYLLTYLPKV